MDNVEVIESKRSPSFYEMYLQTYADNLSFTEAVSPEEKLLLLINDIRLGIPLLSRMEAMSRGCEVSEETHAAEAKINARITKMHNDILRDWIQNQDMARLSEHSSEIPEDDKTTPNEPPKTPLKVQQIPWTLDEDAISSHPEVDQNIIEDTDSDSGTDEEEIVLPDSPKYPQAITGTLSQSSTTIPRTSDEIIEMIWNGDM